MKTYYITTLGCPKNEADSRAMERSMRRRGFASVEDPETADVHLINSCTFIQSAKEETIQTVLDAADVKREHGEQTLVLAGCFAQRYEQVIPAELPEIDYSFGTGLYHRAGELIADYLGQAAPGPRASGEVPDYSVPGRGASFAPVKISDGCDRGCGFCAIPLFRGKFSSIPAADIVEECRLLAEEGVREICLVSQDTNAYGGKAEALLDLMEAVQTIDGVRWIRPLYLYPDPRTEQILRGIRERGIEKVVPYFESPVQHVSDAMLRAMRRFGDYERFRDLFALARELRPETEIRTSFLLGYPGETSADVDRVLRFVEEVRPEKVALFGYSPEEGTPGADLDGELDEDEINERLNLVRDAHLSVLREIHRSRVGRIFDCMVDEVTPDMVTARRAQDAPEVDEVVFLAPVPGLVRRPGDIFPVEITGFMEYDMTGIAVS